MFEEVTIDYTSPGPFTPAFTAYEERLISFTYFLADYIVDAGRFLIRTHHSSKTVPTLLSGNISPITSYWTPEDKDELRLTKWEEIVYADYALFEPGWGWSSSDYEIYKSGVLVFSKQPWVKKAILTQEGLTAKTAILVLAAAGLDIVVPNIIVNPTAYQEILKAKEILAGERYEYIMAITKVADEAFDRLYSGVYRDVIDWASNESIFKLKPRAEELRKSLGKLDKVLVKKLGYESFKDGVPVLGKTYLNDELDKTKMVTVEESLLKTLCTSLLMKLEERRIPEANYGIKLADLISFQPDQKLWVKELQNANTSEDEYTMVSILFLAADPTEASRLRLGEESREIQEKLQLAKLREKFQLHY